MAGDEMTGVTIMRLDEGLDTGPVLTAQAVDILDDENTGQLTDRLSVLGARLLADALPGYLIGEIEPVPQSDDGATYADKIERADRPITPDDGADSVVGRVRGLAPEPAATLLIDNEPHKIYEVRLSEAEVERGRWQRVDGLPVAGFSGGSVELRSLQSPGRNRQSGADWVNGRQRDQGSIT